jgi:hypothetical protein
LSSAVALARRAAHHWREFECMTWLATVELEQGRHEDVLRHVDAIAAAAARMGEPQAPFAQALGALARLQEGDGVPEGIGSKQQPGRRGMDRTRAGQDLHSSLAALRELDDKAHLAYALNEAAGLSLQGGRSDEAAGLAAEALAAAQAVRRPTEVAVAAARLAWACARGASECDPMAASVARGLLDEWPRSWAGTGLPGARADAAMAAAREATLLNLHDQPAQCKRAAGDLHAPNRRRAKLRDTPDR